MRDSGSALTVVSIVGWGRSGSTLLSRILGESPEAFVAGELRWIAAPGTPCGCGLHVQDCPFWAPVLRRTAARSGVTLDQLLDAQTSTLLPRRTPWLLTGAGGCALDHIGSFMHTLYLEIAEQAGCQVIVDSSKDPASAAIVNRLARSGINPRWVHLVRDPRASAWSWSKRERAGLPSFPMALAAFRWLEWNVLVELVFRVSRAPHLRVRYEDFVAAPHRWITEVAAIAGIHELPTHPDASSVSLGANHMVGSNPNRSSRGSIPIRADEEWRGRIRTRDALLTTVICAPGILRHGYRLNWRTGGPTP